ncbi:hypothetical protein ATN79_20525 [Paraburkholderia caribensis]|nr:hypothetical protein ATN79_20525 [Paraburkholderia caribensis]
MSVLTNQRGHIVVGFEHEADARRFWDAMRSRLEEFSLELHPEKTRLLEFGRDAAANRQSRGLGRPETFTFLGFIFICGRSRRGAFQLQRKTRGDRMRARLRQIKEALRKPMHEPIPVQEQWLRQVVRGYFAYHAVPTNSRALVSFRHHVAGRCADGLQTRDSNGVRPLRPSLDRGQPFTFSSPCVRQGSDRKNSV